MRAKDPSPDQLRILLLGGFEVWSQGEQLRGFESQKVRALLAYLVLHAGRSQSRDRLAGLFWGDKDDETARRNLRQAIYSLKATLPGEDSGRPHLIVDHQQVRFDRDSDYWLDVEAFEHALGPRGDTAAAGFHDLIGAAQLYRGDLLAGFLLKDCPHFEEWLVTQQERLREAALEALRTLVGSYLARGEHRLGIQLARRLVAMDPLSEEAHRHLMRLYDMAGQRDRALAHYASLRELLRRELSIEPLAETRALHDGILSEALRAEAAAEKPGALGPIVPLVGREEPYLRLSECWRAVVDGACRVTLIAGEEGIGKTRLARSFIDAATAHRSATVLTATCYDQFPQPSGHAVVQALRQALGSETTQSEVALAGLSPENRRELSRLLPELAAPGEVAADASPSAGHDRLAEAISELLHRLALADPADAGGQPAILFFDDLQWADAGTLALLESLPRWLAGARVWILGAYDPAGLAEPHLLRRLAARDGDGLVTEVELERLDASAIAEIANALVGEARGAALASLLGTASAGLPLALVTLINAMWDEAELVADENGRWRFEGSSARWEAPAREGLDRLLVRRVRRLPTSTRRLASMAAVIGQRFEAELLRRAEDEHRAVVEVGLELLLERWLVRQQREHWNPTGLESTLALWSRGARQGWFQFDHPRIRSVLYNELNPIRRQVLHRQIATALEELHPDATASVAEDLAYHYLQAGVWDRAYRYLLLSADRAAAALDPEDALRCWDHAAKVVERLRHQTTDAGEQARWASAQESLSRTIAAARA